jgi:hypothetical protein
VFDVDRPCTSGVGRGVSAACPTGDGPVVAFGDCTSLSSSSTSIASMSELIVAVSADNVDLIRFPLLFFAFARQESSPWSAACVAARRPWTEPCATWQEPRCHSPPSSRRCTRRREEVAPPAHPPRRGLCSCTGPRRAAVPGTSRCLHGTAQQDENIHENQDVYSKNSRSKNVQGRKLTRSTRLYIATALGHSLLRIHPPKMFFA